VTGCARGYYLGRSPSSSFHEPPVGRYFSHCATRAQAVSAGRPLTARRGSSGAHGTSGERLRCLLVMPTASA